ncbi:WD domain, G-beta repeat-containing protein [Cardiosporidium cionae]|uniref:WD domain, G-beta repeat-containing protein n=1 Tax=Cardiosporidium cionae TaxID=476202 RepID=A0ABQ7J8S3_9APIC|nr:WD domain, G-beta repeat-containing protein [Cardiosporidium cionae]|eukprot:KAF8820377.1 WD domain, G-beta repeat-containing protein [Cardiosporidium cionae]
MRGSRDDVMPVCVSIGTYDGDLKGYVLQKDSSLSILYAFHSQSSLLRSMASCNEILCIGGINETIQLYNLSTRQSLGSLLNAFGSVNCLSLFYPSHLLSGTEDGSLCLWRASDWELLRILKGHKGAVSSVAIHPSGRLAISCGNDKTIRLWDLLRGTCAMTSPLIHVPLYVGWSSDGLRYVLYFSSKISIFLAGTEEMDILTPPNGKSYSSCCFDATNFLLVGYSDGTLAGYSLSIETSEEGTLTWSFKLSHTFEGSHKCRVKGVVLLQQNRLTAHSKEILFCSGDSFGCIHVWKALHDEKNLDVQSNLKPLSTIESNVRITCMSSNIEASMAEDSLDISSVTKLFSETKSRKGSEKSRASIKAYASIKKVPISHSTIIKKPKNGLEPLMGTISKYHPTSFRNIRTSQYRRFRRTLCLLRKFKRRKNTALVT